MTVIPFRKRNPAAVEPFQAQTPAPNGVRALGIDLGTTNSVVSLYSPDQQEPETLLYRDMPLVPSVLYYSSVQNTTLVGQEAKDAAASKPETLVRGTKRCMGSLAQNFFSNENAFSPEEAATHILTHLASHPELGKEREQHGGLWAVITVPAHFDDAARQATLRAAEKAGIHVLRFVNEPTAAALAYSMLPDARNSANETLAVYDFGGGTFDVSIVGREGLVFNVLSSEGDIYLGGDDIDFAIAQHLARNVKPFAAGHNAKPDSPLFRKLLNLAEEAKITLETEGIALIHDEDLDSQGTSIHYEFKREIMEELALPFVQKTIELTEKALHAARRRPSQLSRILLVGGSTRLGVVQKMLRAHFAPCSVDARLEPDFAVSWGAAVQAAIILGIEPGTILVDVCSHTLGIGIAEDSITVNENYKKISRKYGLLRPLSEEQLQSTLGEKAADFHRDLQNLLKVATIIHRNSPLPSRKSEFFNTIFEKQNAVQVIVVQGEGDTVGDNRLIGSFVFPLKQPCPQGTRCEIQLTYDSNGMVHVIAKQLETDNVAEARFDSRTGKVVEWQKLPETLPDVTATQAVNSLVVRTRRLLTKGVSSPEITDHLSTLLNAYEQLLAEARSGAENDTEIDFLERKLIAMLDGISHE